MAMLEVMRSVLRTLLVTPQKWRGRSKEQRVTML